jgi:hypothetical protein
MTSPRFFFRCSYMGCCWYDVIDQTGKYEMRIRWETSDYERSIWNPAGDYERDAVRMVGWAVAGGRRIPAETLLTWNAARRAQSAEANAWFDANPDRYGVIPVGDSLRAPSLIVKGCAYWADGDFVFLALEGDCRPMSPGESRPGQMPLGRYAVEICDLNGRVLRAFDLPIAPNMVSSQQRWIPGADIPPELAEDHDANVIWYGLNEGRWPRDKDGLALEASEHLTDENGVTVAIWRARRIAPDGHIRG